MRQRCVYLESFAGFGDLGVGVDVLERAHVVQPVHQFDHDHADVRGHGQEHFAQVLRLQFLFGGHRDVLQFGDAVHQVGNILAELRGDIFQRHVGVFHRVVEHAGNDRSQIHVHIREHGGNSHRMYYERLAGFALLPFMRSTGQGVRFI